MSVSVRRRGRQPYEASWAAMRAFTESRGPDSDDEIWLLEHPPVYTLGMAGRPEHVLGDTGEVPLVRSDRGGQVTYHGPGQLIAYVLVDLKRAGIGVKSLVDRTEQAVIDLLADHGIPGERRAAAPGVYVDGAKVAALGYRIRRGCSYHGLALNVDMDLRPFAGINPCGYAGLPVTSLAMLGCHTTVDDAGEQLAGHLIRRLSLSAAAAAATMVGQPPDAAQRRISETRR